VAKVVALLASVTFVAFLIAAIRTCTSGFPSEAEQLKIILLSVLAVLFDCGARVLWNVGLVGLSRRRVRLVPVGLVARKPV
jgi:hypothetical protein